MVILYACTFSHSLNSGFLKMPAIAIFSRPCELNITWTPRLVILYVGNYLQDHELKRSWSQFSDFHNKIAAILICRDFVNALSNEPLVWITRDFVFRQVTCLAAKIKRFGHGSMIFEMAVISAQEYCEYCATGNTYQVQCHIIIFIYLESVVVN